MIVSFVGIDLGDSQCQHGHGEELEGVFERRAVSDLGQRGILGSCFGVRRGLEGAESSLDYVPS